MSVLPSAKLLSDERLALLAGGGSDPAFAMLYRRYDGALHGYCLSIVRDADEARDALQNAWIKVLVALRRGTRSAPVRPWLFRIVHNEAISLLRRRSRHEPLTDSHRAGSAGGADEEAASREELAEVVSDLRFLPESQRAALVMREWADLGYGEIALALATSEGNARQLVYQARTGLTEWRDARVVPCDAIRQELAQADGRRLRKRGVRAHLSTCEACREFSVEIRDRRRAAAAAMLPWSPLAGAGVIESVVSAAGGSASAAGGSAVLTSLAKGAAVAALVTGGVGTADLVSNGGSSGWVPERAGVVSAARDGGGMPVADAGIPPAGRSAAPSTPMRTRPAAARGSTRMRIVGARRATATAAGSDPTTNRGPGVRPHRGPGVRPPRTRDERRRGDSGANRHDRPSGDRSYGDRRGDGDRDGAPPNQTASTGTTTTAGDGRTRAARAPSTHTNVLRSFDGTHTDGWWHEGISPRN